MDIIQIAAYVTAIGVIALGLSKIYKTIKLIDDKIVEFNDNLTENTLSTLRLVIINEKMPLNERLKSGMKYTEMGGNGEVHALYEFLCEEYKKNCK